jgi:hypothetical protein
LLIFNDLRRSLVTPEYKNKMDNKELKVAERTLAALQLELEEQEGIFHNLRRRVITDVIGIGSVLHTIKSKELWKARKFDFWHEYVQDYLGLDVHLADRWTLVYQVTDRLKGAGLMLPENESQAVELSRAPEDRQVTIWKDLVDKMDAANQAPTVVLIKHAIVIDERKRESASELPVPRKSSGKGITVELSDEDEEDEKEKTPPSTLRLTETGEAALDRIKTICGKAVAQAITEGRLKIPQRDLIQWAEADDQLVHNLAYYMVNLRWSLTKALNYEEQLIDGETTIDQLVTLTQARGGKYAFSWEANRFTVETNRK